MASSTTGVTQKPPLSPPQTPTPVVTTVGVSPSRSIITTTITSGDSGSLSTAGTVPHSNASNVPIAAIAGGAAAGVVLALVAVVGWTWWGRCIKRRSAKERREALAFLQMRENTRRNASTLSHPVHQYKPASSMRGHHDRKVTFVPAGSSSSHSTLKGTTDQKMMATDSEKQTRKAPPRPPTPSAHLKDELRKPEAGLPPPIPRRNPQRERTQVEPITPLDAPPSYMQHCLMHQASTLSSGSVYSTQSAIEDRHSGVPSSLLLALANEGNRRSFLASYLPWNRYRTSVASNNRLSEYSTGSVYSQFDDQPWESVGFAFGENDDLPRR